MNQRWNNATILQSYSLHFSKKKTWNDNSIITIIQEISQDNNFENNQRFNIEIDDDELTKKNVDTNIVVDNNQQRIRNLQKKIAKLRNETKISKLKIRTKRFRVEVDATTIVKSFFVITKNVNVLQKKNMFDDDMTTKSMTIFHKSFKSDKLKNYKKIFEKKHRHWMREAKLIFIKNFDYFSNDRTKILWNMIFLIDDSQI